MKFQANELIRALQAHNLPAMVEQMGGGVAAVLIDIPEDPEPLIIGPGAYDWTIPQFSQFHTGELFYGPDVATRDGRTKPDDPPSWQIPDGTPVGEIARAVAARYRALNA
jgi:hypothetical protein